MQKAQIVAEVVVEGRPAVLQRYELAGSLLAKWIRETAATPAPAAEARTVGGRPRGAGHPGHSIPGG